MVRPMYYLFPQIHNKNKNTSLFILFLFTFVQETKAMTLVRLGFYQFVNRIVTICVRSFCEIPIFVVMFIITINKSSFPTCTSLNALVLVFQRVEPLAF